LEEVRKDCETLRKAMKELSENSQKMIEMSDELRIQKRSVEQKLREAETRLEENKIEMVGLREQLKEEQLKVIFQI